MLPAQAVPSTWLPARCRILSGSILKIIAVVCMLIDHTALFILKEIPLFRTVWCTVGSRAITPYFLMRTVGRLAFPLYVFLLIEGFIHTHNRRRYALNLLIFAVISELPWNFVFTGTWHHDRQNVFFTLFFGLCAIWLMEFFQKKPLFQLLCLAGVLGVSFIFGADYGYAGVAFIVVMYALREHPAMQILSSMLIPNSLMAMAAFVPIGMYNGRRGFIRGPIAKYIFYAFYPLHLLILGIIRHKILP